MNRTYCHRDADLNKQPVRPRGQWQRDLWVSWEAMESNEEDRDGFPGFVNRERPIKRFAGFHCERPTSLQRSQDRTVATLVPSRTFRVRHPVCDTVPSSVE